VLPLLCRSLILAIASLASGQEVAAARTSPWSFGIGTGVEYFHWHETSQDQWCLYSVQLDKCLDVQEGPPHRFLTETGFRYLPQVQLEYRPSQALAFSARARGILGTVDYDGGLQTPLRWLLDNDLPVDSAEFDGVTYIKSPKRPYDSYTGYRGYQLDFQARVSDVMGAVAGRRAGFEGIAGYSIRSTRRLIAYTTTRSAGYDEVWDLSWVDLGLGGFVVLDGARLGVRWGLLVPLSTKETIEEVPGGADFDGDGDPNLIIKLVPKTQNGWRSSLYWERIEGVRLELGWEKRAYKVSDANRGVMQPASLESMGRLDINWFF
jgi:hypothetical protein